MRLIALVGSGLLALPLRGGTRIAVIGDYGIDNASEASVAARVAAVNPDFVATVGDNNYLTGSLEDWDATQGQYYSPFIKYPPGSPSAYASNGVTVNRFFPTLGNHDWDAGVGSYLAYFDLPKNPSGNSRYYSFTAGPVEFFMIDSDPREPDDGNLNGAPGNAAEAMASTQGQWLRNGLAASTARWQIVNFHHPAYTSPSGHGATEYMRWDFKQWGADAVLTGHNHHMERLNVNGLPYFVGGAGGKDLYSFTGVDPNSVFRNSTSFGLLQIDADEHALLFRFLDTAGTTLDTLYIPEPGGSIAATLSACIATLRLPRTRSRG